MGEEGLLMVQLSEIEELKMRLAAAQTRAPAKLRDDVKEAQLPGLPHRSTKLDGSGWGA